MAIAAALPWDVIEQLRAMYLAKDADGTWMHKVEIIAAELGFDHRLVIKYTSDLPRRTPHEEAKRLKTIELYAEGRDVRGISRELKIPIRTVLRALTPAPEPPRRPTAEDLQKWREAERERQRPANEARNRARAEEQGREKATRAVEREQAASVEEPPPRRVQVSSEQHDRIRAMWTDGSTRGQIVEALGVAPHRVQYAVRDMPRQARPSAETIAKVREMYAAGDRVRDIVAATSVSIPTVYLHTRDLPRRRVPTLAECMSSSIGPTAPGSLSEPS